MLKDEFSKIEKYLSEGKIEEELNFFEKLLKQYPKDLSLKLSFADFLLTGETWNKNLKFELEVKV